MKLTHVWPHPLSDAAVSLMTIESVGSPRVLGSRVARARDHRFQTISVSLSIAQHAQMATFASGQLVLSYDKYGVKKAKPPLTCTAASYRANGLSPGLRSRAKLNKPMARGSTLCGPRFVKLEA